MPRNFSTFDKNFAKPFWVFVFAYALTCFSAIAQNGSLNTASESTVGLSALNYKYDEPGYMMLKANRVGLNYSATYAPGAKWPNSANSWFYKAELAYSNGKADYTSPISGNLKDTANMFYEARLLTGKDIDMGSYVLSPYIGLGYRHLFSDLGYERTSNYTTMPIGFTHKVKLADKSQLHTTLEYTHLLSGVQKVQLIQNVSMDQKSGYGLRFSMLRRFDIWSLGPTLTYWKLDQSEVGGLTPLYEPKNKTLEIGLKGAFHF
jgi:hypothetical protein